MVADLKFAFVFPGQGSQETGMGIKLFEKYNIAKNLFKRADELLGLEISKICFHGPDEELNNTINLQPSIFLISIICYEIAKDMLGSSMPKASYLAGHSLGEYSALVVGNVTNFEDALKIVRSRGQFMEKAASKNNGGMLALLGADEIMAKEICQNTDTEISNINAPGQIVISGLSENINRAKGLAEAKGIRRTRILKVSGAFHSRWMEEAATSFDNYLKDYQFNDSEIPIISNINAHPIIYADEIKKDLSKQITSCVQWKKSIEYIISQGINAFIEFGHGQVINNLIKRINPDVTLFSIGDADIENDIKVLVNRLKDYN